MSASPFTVPGPLLFFAVPLALAVLAYLLHRWTALSGLVAAIGSLGLGWIALYWLLDKPISLLGRSLILTPDFVFLGRPWALTAASAVIVVFGLIVGGLCFLLALPASQGWAFYPFGLAVLGVLNLSATAEQVIYVILFFWLGTVLTGFVLAGGRPGTTMGALRLIISSTLAAMLLLLLPTFLQSDADPSTQRAGVVLGILGLSVLLMMPPFHGALVGAAAFSAPMPPAFILSILPVSMLHIFFQLVETYPTILEDGSILDLCRWLGLGAVILGGLAAPGQRRWGSLIGYAMLIDWGISMIALGQGSPEGMALAVNMLVGRSLALLLCGAGLTPLFQAAGKKDDLDQCRGLLFHRPLNVLALLLGLLMLAGLPTPFGVAGRWALIPYLVDTNPQIVWIIILAGIGVAVSAVVGLLACLGKPDPKIEGQRWEETIAFAFGLLALWMVGALLLNAPVWQMLLENALSTLSVFAP
ncbi:MAG: hypothetical protein JW934_20075 [Anaerolineae bacterium]|nr:hypothetical protein [Anaerolineae bacterium]